MTVHITGSTGFVGSNLVSYLTLNRPTTLLLPVRRKAGPSPYCNLQQELELSHGALVHLAGKAHDTAGTFSDQQDLDEYEIANFSSTKQVFDQFMASSLEKFIFVSSVKAVADQTVGTLDEDAVPRPVTRYGQSKLRAEEYIRSWDWGDKKVYIIRPCMIHGRGNKGNLNLLYQFVRLNIPYPLGAFVNARSLLGVENAMYVIDRLLFSDVESGVYNVADDEPLSTIEMVQIIGDTLGRHVRIAKVPITIVRTGAKFGDRLPLPLNSERLVKLTEDFVVTNRKLKGALGIQAMPVTVKDGLRHTVQALQENQRQRNPTWRAQ